ncbi:aldehyde dehydrogenase [Priestia megaterium]|uniref:aldehyde dehydrogenase family protein n=1 Tax=Priestia megaterium TaxID=1404 RepID=UPI000BF7FF49|nr:aldehyde dehydrogenase family protein [Priestia megaterium]MBW0931376.1 aldehyde dehydrogenase family protein [Priestia megaterium]PEW08987.1 aldehyde dehydrogenase [Priestia megaterium]
MKTINGIGKLIINGIAKNSRDNQFVDVLNPATNEVIDRVPLATKEDVEEALDVARKGFDIWSNTPTHERYDILVRFAELLKEHKSEIAEILTLENGKPLEQSEAEVDTGVRLFKGFAEKSKSLYGISAPLDAQPGLEKDIFFTRREPIGVMGAILPFNFPIDLFSHKVAPALAAGNAVVIKPATEAPLTLIRITELLHQAGVPGSVMQVITGRGSLVGEILASSSKVDIVSMTGDTQTGIRVAQNAAKNLSRTFLELGGNDALIVFDDADIDVAVEHAAFGRTWANGQCCCANKRMIIQKNIVDDFTHKLIKKLQEYKLGNPMDRSTKMGPLISQKAANTVKEQIDYTVNQGARVLYGGERLDNCFLVPTVLRDVTKDMDVARDLEIFGPVLPIIEFSNDLEAINVANNSIYGLSGSVFTKDISRALNTSYKMKTGQVAINGTGLYRPDAAQFGGYKQSGLGREGLSITLEEMTQVKNIAIRDVLK